MSDKRLCPDCKQWIDIGLRRKHETYMRHIRDNHPATYKKMQEATAALNSVTSGSEWGGPSVSNPTPKAAKASAPVVYGKPPHAFRSPSDGHKEGCKCPAHKNRVKVDGIWVVAK